MKKKQVAALLCCFLIAYSGDAWSQTSDSIAENPDVAAAIALLETYIENQITYTGAPGISLAIVYDQELVWSRGYGFADLERRIPATSATLYRIGSISKLFTSIAVLKLRDEGKLRLDDNVETFLPWFEPKNKFTDAPPIKVRHLLSHTSGLPMGSRSPYWSTFEFPSSKEIADGIRSQELVLPTQSRFKYSNLGFAVAGELVAVVAGTSYGQFVREQILEPLSMSETYSDLPDGAMPRLATGYGRRMPDGTRDVLPYSEMRGITPAAGFTSTVNDLARLASWQFRLLDGGTTEVLKPYTLREMQAVQWLHPSWEWGWGLGFELVHMPDRNLVGHEGMVGGYHGALFLSLREKVAVIALTNAVDGVVAPGRQYSIVAKAFEWIAPAIVKAKSPPVQNIEPDPAWKQYAGTYRAWWADLTVLVLKGRLVLFYSRGEDPVREMLTLVPEKTGAFRVEGDGFEETGELVTFESESSGAIVGMRLGNDYYERVDRRKQD